MISWGFTTLDSASALVPTRITNASGQFLFTSLYQNGTSLKEA
jgi:hypothetical protein